MSEKRKDPTGDARKLLSEMEELRHYTEYIDRKLAGDFAYDISRAILKLRARITELEEREKQLEEGWRDAEQRYEKRNAELESQLRELSQWVTSIEEECLTCAHINNEPSKGFCYKCAATLKDYKRHPVLKIAYKWSERSK